MQGLREPRRDDRLDRILASAIEVIAVLDDLHGARASGAGVEIFGGVVIAPFPVARNVKRRAFDLRGEREPARRLVEAVAEALAGWALPPAAPSAPLAARPRARP